MADTILNTPERGTREVDSAGWAIAIVILLAVVIGGLLLFRQAGVTPGTPNTGTDLNVTVPSGGDASSASGGTDTGSMDGSSGSTGGSSGSTGGTSGSGTDTQ